MSKHRSRFLPFLLCLVFLCSACGGDDTKQATPTLSQPAGTTRTVTAQGTFEEYPLPQERSGLMRPVIDHTGRVWFGEMGRNYLTFFDPQAQTFVQLTPPHGAHGIMGLAVAPDNAIWFAEQYANYIGQYNPTTHSYRTYQLPLLQKPDPSNSRQVLSLPSAPNAIALDTSGCIWFTEMNADALGRLDPKTGQIKQYPITTPRTIQKLSPYGLTIDPKGFIWFTEASTNKLGRLDPQTGKISHFSAPATDSLMELGSTSTGTIWATTFGSGAVLRFDPPTNRFTAYTPDDRGGGIYGLTITRQDEVWLTLTSANALAHLDSHATQFISYQVPTSSSGPLGIAVDKKGVVWFTEAGSNKLGRLTI